MQFFLDSANLREIERIQNLGYLDGITTNPSLIAKENVQFNYHNHIKEIINITNDLIPVSAEVISLEYNEMLRDAMEFANLSSNICVKLPVTQDGIRVCKVLSSQNIKTNMTLCFSPLQALVVAKVGATYVSPFIGRIDDIGCNGVGVIEDIKTIFENYPEYNTQILAASVRNLSHLIAVAKIGADVATIPYNLFTQIVANQLTDIGVQKFVADYNSNKS